MNPIIEQILDLIHTYFKLFTEVIFLPFVNKLHAPQQRNDEITINIDINTRPSRSRRERRQVSFGNMEVRTYESILGDNPSCSRGPPLAIGWKYGQSRVMNIPQGDRPQTDQYDLLIDRTEREHALLQLGYTRREIVAATRRSLRDKKKRRQTVDNLGCASFMEEKVEGIKKSIFRHVLLKKGSKALYNDWKKVNEPHNSRSPLGISWHKAHSVLVLSREDKTQKHNSDQGGIRESDGTESVSSDDVSVSADVALSSTSNCKLSIRKGSPARMPAHRTASL